MILGAKIGEGAKRAAYFHPDNKEWIIKVYKSEGLERTNQLWYEWENWKIAKELGLDKYLVPCVEYGEHWLIMEYAKSVPKGVKVSKKPWMHDTKLPNWGIHKGVPKLLDYGSKAIYSNLKKYQDSGTFFRK